MGIAATRSADARHHPEAGRRRRAVVVAASASLAIVAAACGAPDIRVEESSPITGDRPTPDGPAARSDSSESSTSPSTTPPSTTLPSPTSTAPDPATAPDPSTTQPPVVVDVAEREPELGVGDQLFPELGSADLDVESYVVRLDATEPTGELTGSVELTASVASDLAAVALDVDGPTVERVVVDGAETAFELDVDELIIDTTREQVADGEATIVVDYRVTPIQGVPSSVGLPIGWIVAGDGAFVLNQPDGASSWLPSNDHPSDRATWRFEIDAAVGHTVSANGELVQRPDEDEPGTWVWQQDVSMPTYLMHLVVGSYELIDGGVVVSSDGDEIPLTHLVPTGQTDRFADAIAGVPERIAFFETLFGPYPLDRYGLAFVEELSGLAMETQGRSLFGAPDFAGRGAGYLQELLLAHELAHQWFGNAVTPAEWDDLWLNESFATYAQWLWLEERGLQPLDAWADRVLEQRQASSRDATADPSVSNLFGFERYDGGAVVVHALRLQIGDDRFFELLRRWIDDNVETSRTTEDFITLAEEIADTDLDAFFDDWLFAVEPPAEYPG